MRRAIIILVLAIIPATSWASGFYLPRWLDWLLSIGMSCEQPCGAGDDEPQGEATPPADRPEAPASEAEEQQEPQE